MRAQITLTVDQGKKLISEAISQLDIVKAAIKNGKLLLKGGTTVSFLAEKLVDMPLKISGRITSSGAKASALLKNEHPHSILIENSSFENVDKIFLETILAMGKDDVIVIGANAIDVYGNAAMMVGAPGGGFPGSACSAIASEGSNVIIACGLEKLISGNILDLVKKTGRKKTDLAMGMSVGLIPIFGDIITEKEALEIIGNVEVTVIGKGGLYEAASALTMVVDGDEKEVKKVLRFLDQIKATKVSGHAGSLIECTPGASCKKEHLACCYRNNKLLKEL